LYGLKRAGFQHLIGVDPFIKCDAMQYSNGVSVFKKPVEELSGAEVFDVIMFHHSFEHIPDQLKTLEAVYKLLKRNGTCFLRIPVLSSYMMQHYGTQWVHWDAPRHYFLHSLKSIAVLADKAGFRVEQIVHETNFTSLLWSELYKQKLSLGATFKYLLNPLNYAKVYGFIRQANKLNRAQDADCVAVYLRK
jgi:predicted SAM-dependent methyltransferase